MKISTVSKQHGRRILLVACLTTMVVALATRPAQAQDDERVAVPPVPTDLRVEAGNKPYLVGHAVGTQNYVCLPSGSGFAWSLFGPQATLFNEDERQAMTHFLSPNPEEANTARATWQSRDTSRVWAFAIKISSDSAYVAPGAIPWLLLQVVGRTEGPDGGDKLMPTTYIQRVNTEGGPAPAVGCSVITDVGRRAFVPYTADYYFYKKTGRRN